ncbi:hypothetical protein ACQP2U_13905 [Nocardia sp. CA-084685]|uniref:hypothetical protein n=1 Tax=Nocardia sp. CA-084685 TaxID=3239970 RepID=UPI003D982D2B
MSLFVGDRVLLIGHCGHRRLVLHPPAALDERLRASLDAAVIHGNIVWPAAAPNAEAFAAARADALPGAPTRRMSKNFTAMAIDQQSPCADSMPCSLNGTPGLRRVCERVGHSREGPPATYSRPASGFPARDEYATTRNLRFQRSLTSVFGGGCISGSRGFAMNRPI